DIADEGSGIPEDELCNIWKRFYRGKNAENHSGVGIGLYLTSNILTAEGGRVSAKSSPDGSIFTIYLPQN
nr:sensor histidine kinase [Clostridia bacterium]